MASGAVNTARQLGFAVGVAVLGSVFTARTTSTLSAAGTPDAAATATALTGGAAPQLLDQASPEARGGLGDLFATAYADGLRDVFLACGAAGILGGVLVFWLVRSAAPGAEQQPVTDEPAEQTEPAVP
jgi:hypothetical protein